MTKLVKLTVEELLEKLPKMPRYSCGWVAEYQDGGHEGHRFDENGELADWSSCEMLLQRLAEALYAQDAAANALAQRDAQIEALEERLRRSEDYCIGIDEERMDYINKCEMLTAENVALKHGAEYFMYGPDCGFERYDSQDAAIKAANEMIDDYREDADDGWCDEVDAVCVGVILKYAQQCDKQEASEDNYFLGSVNYVMPAIQTPATDAAANALRAEGLEMLAEQCEGYALNHVYTYTKLHAKEFAKQLREGKK